MKITPKQLKQLIREELSSVREIDTKNPWEDDSIEDVIDAYATDSIVFGHSIGSELQEAMWTKLIVVIQNNAKRSMLG